MRSLVRVGVRTEQATPLLRSRVLPLANFVLVCCHASVIFTLGYSTLHRFNQKTASCTLQRLVDVPLLNILPQSPPADCKHEPPMHLDACNTTRKCRLFNLILLRKNSHRCQFHTKQSASSSVVVSHNIDTLDTLYTSAVLLVQHHIMSNKILYQQMLRKKLMAPSSIQTNGRVLPDHHSLG